MNQIVFVFKKEQKRLSKPSCEINVDRNNNVMILADAITSDCVASDLKSLDKTEVIDELSTILSDNIDCINREDVLSAILEREKLGSTGIGYGVAIPHGKVDGIDRVYIAFGRSKSGVDFDSLDSLPAHLFFLIVAPSDSTSSHLKTLASISELLKEEDFRHKLLNATDAEDIYNVIVEGEKLI